MASGKMSYERSALKARFFYENFCAVAISNIPCCQEMQVSMRWQFPRKKDISSKSYRGTVLYRNTWA